MPQEIWKRGLFEKIISHENDFFFLTHKVYKYWKVHRKNILQTNLFFFLSFRSPQMIFFSNPKGMDLTQKMQILDGEKEHRSNKNRG